MRVLSWLALPLSLACAHRPAEAVAPSTPSAPHLPSPVGALYVRHLARPVDPLVAKVVGSDPWEEVLSGAAAGVALEVVARREVDLSAARWAAVRAGYPYPLLDMQVVHVPHEALPTLVLPDSGDLGLVRARGPDDDVWVLLRGASGPALPPVPREAQVGDMIPLSGAQWRASDPSGAVRVVEKGLLLDRAGEWLLEAEVAGRVVATLPVYVGERTPETPPFTGPLAGDDPEQAMFNALADLWDWYGRDAPVRDSGIDSVARVRLRALSAGGETEPAATLLRRSGFVDGANGGECRADSLRACLEQMWWSADQRAIFAPDFSSVGVAAQGEGQGVRVVVMVAR